MRYGGGFRFLVALVFVGIIAALTAGAYAAGFAAGAGSNASVSPWVSGGFAGLGSVLGLIVTIFVLVMIFRVMAFAFWGHSRRGWDRGPGGPVGPDGTPFGGPGFHHGWGTRAGNLPVKRRSTSGIASRTSGRRVKPRGPHREEQPPVDGRHPGPRAKSILRPGSMPPRGRCRTSGRLRSRRRGAFRRVGRPELLPGP